MNISTKKLKLGLKNHLTIDMLAEENNCSADDVVDYLTRKFSNNQKYLRDVWHQFEQNLKYQERLASSQERRVTKKEEGFDQVLDAYEKIGTELQENGLDERACLELQERELSNQVMKSECEHADRAREYHEYRKSVRRREEKILELKRQLDQENNLLNAEAPKINDYIREMNEAWQQRQKLMEDLAKVRARLAELNTVTLFVYDDGSITQVDDTDSIPDISLDETGTNELYLELREKSYCEELRIKDIRLLARVVAITRNSNLEINLEFDRDEVRAAYDQYVAETQVTEKQTDGDQQE